MGRRKRFCVLVHPTRRHFADATGEDATVLKKTQTRKTDIHISHTQNFTYFKEKLWKNKKISLHSTNPFLSSLPTTTLTQYSFPSSTPTSSHLPHPQTSPTTTNHPTPHPISLTSRLGTQYAPTLAMTRSLDVNHFFVCLVGGEIGCPLHTPTAIQTPPPPLPSHPPTTSHSAHYFPLLTPPMAPAPPSWVRRPETSAVQLIELADGSLTKQIFIINRWLDNTEERSSTQ